MFVYWVCVCVWFSLVNHHKSQSDYSELTLEASIQYLSSFLVASDIHTGTFISRHVCSQHLISPIKSGWRQCFILILERNFWYFSSNFPVPYNYNTHAQNLWQFQDNNLVKTPEASSCCFLTSSSILVPIILPKRVYVNTIKEPGRRKRRRRRRDWWCCPYSQWVYISRALWLVNCYSVNQHRVHVILESKKMFQKTLQLQFVSSSECFCFLSQYKECTSW